MELKDKRERAMKSVRILHVLYYRNKKVWTAVVSESGYEVSTTSR